MELEEKESFFIMRDRRKKSAFYSGLFPSNNNVMFQKSAIE